MNILILINNAPNYIDLFKELGDKFKENNDNVIYAIESKFPEIKYKNNISDSKKYYFSEHENSNYTDITNKFAKYNLRETYYPDFDRHLKLNYAKSKDKNMDKYIKRLLSFFDYIIKKENIDFIFYENISNVFSNISYLAAKKNGIHYLGLKNARIPGRFDIWFDKYPNLDKLKCDFNNFNINEISKEEKKYITDYMDNITNVKPDFLENHIKSYKQKYLKYYFKKINLIKDLIKYHFFYKEDRKKSVEIENVFNQSYQSVKRHLLRKVKIKLLENNFDKNKCDHEEYYLYPIHFQPESSTSINAQYFDDQLDLIKKIVFSLPLNIKLYVKDHPHAYGYFPIEFYKKIKALPNVKLIHCGENVNKLINNSEGIITLTSTMGFEALMNKKPVISFGKVFYNIHPYCYSLNTVEDLFETIKRIKKQEFNNFYDYNLRLLYAHYKNTYNGKLVIYNKSKTEIEEIFKNTLNVMNNLKTKGDST